jgi:starvation-inducible outer membrane lipoprotein
MRKLTILVCLALAGCVTAPAPLQKSQVDALLERPDFQAARAAAPAWCRAALEALAETEKERNKASNQK